MLTTTLVDPAINTSDIWVTDLQRGSATRVTDDPANDLGALWSRAGSLLGFSIRSARRQLPVRAIDLVNRGSVTLSRQYQLSDRLVD